VTLSPILVLVVDDYEPFRQFLSSSLRSTSNEFTLREASDGLDAVQKAEELQPDLVLLDIGLPKLNGFEAARQISKVSPASKILFVSQESSADVVQETFRVGACGYVVKMDAGRELLRAVDTVLRGDRFLGSRFDGHEFAEASHLQVLNSTLQNRESTRRHEAQFYPDDAGFLEGLTQFIDTALRAGNAVIVLATELHRNSLVLKLQERGLDVAAAIEQGRYLSLDALETVSSFMVNDRPDDAQFHKLAGDLIEMAAQSVRRGHGRVAACGECAPLLWAGGNPDAAILLEQLWDEVGKTYDLDILCGYVLSNFQIEKENHIYGKICAEHSAVCCR